MNTQTEEEGVIVNVETRASYEDSRANYYPDDDKAYDTYLGDGEYA